MTDDSRIAKAQEERDDLDRQVLDLTEILRLEYFRRWDQFRAGLTQLQGAHARVKLAKKRQDQNEKERMRAIKWGAIALVFVVGIGWLKDGAIDQSISNLFFFFIAFLTYFYLTVFVKERDQIRLEDIQAEKDRLEFNVESAGVNSVYLTELYRYWDKRGENEDRYPHDEEKADSLDIFNRMQKAILYRVTE